MEERVYDRQVREQLACLVGMRTFKSACVLS